MQYCPGCMKPVRSSESFPGAAAHAARTSERIPEDEFSYGITIGCAAEMSETDDVHRSIAPSYCPHCGTRMDFQNKTYLLPVGTVLKDRAEEPGFLIGKALGQGGFGVTYIGMDLRRKQRVAVKEYFPVRCAMRGADGRTVEANVPKFEAIYEGGRYSFLNEAKMLAGLEGMPSVVQGLAYMECNNTAYLVMEYLDGTPLYRIVQEQGKMSVEQFFPPLRNLMWDIAKLHDRGVIHRDISPDNIMLMPDGSLKLLDFGCARSMEDGKSMTVMVKKGFAPVEQYQSHGQGPWTDVYALAATIYYCLTGEIPPSSVARQMDDAELLSPIGLGAALTPEEESVLLWALSISPKTRPANMEVFVKHLFPFEPAKGDSDRAGEGISDSGKTKVPSGDAAASSYEAETETFQSTGYGSADGPVDAAPRRRKGLIQRILDRILGKG